MSNTMAPTLVMSTHWCRESTGPRTSTLLPGRSNRSCADLHRASFCGMPCIRFTYLYWRSAMIWVDSNMSFPGPEATHIWDLTTTFICDHLVI